jgi:hypothetical protein
MISKKLQGVLNPALSAYKPPEQSSVRDLHGRASSGKSYIQGPSRRARVAELRLHVGVELDPRRRACFLLLYLKCLYSQEGKRDLERWERHVGCLLLWVLGDCIDIG